MIPHVKLVQKCSKEAKVCFTSAYPWVRSTPSPQLALSVGLERSKSSYVAKWMESGRGELGQCTVLAVPAGRQADSPCHHILRDKGTCGGDRDWPGKLVKKPVPSSFSLPN